MWFYSIIVRRSLFQYSNVALAQMKRARTHELVHSLVKFLYDDHVNLHACIFGVNANFPYNCLIFIQNLFKWVSATSICVQDKLCLHVILQTNTKWCQRSSVQEIDLEQCWYWISIYSRFELYVTFNFMHINWNNKINYYELL